MSDRTDGLIRMQRNPMVKVVKSLDKEGCEYGRVNRAKLENISGQVGECLTGINKISEKNEQMFNHFTERYEEMFKEAMTKFPQWIIVVAGIGGVIIGSLAIFALTHGL